MNEFSHLDQSGNIRMVDVSAKKGTNRVAVAEGFIQLQPETLAKIQSGKTPKGNVLTTAKIAGIQGAKKCSDLIPLCHPLMLSSVAVDFQLDAVASCVRIEGRCKVTGKTGVEMEALTAASVAALTIYDMCKAIDKKMVIENIRLVKKSGGKSK